MEMYKQKIINGKNVKEYVKKVKKVNILYKNYKVTSNRNLKPNKEKIYKSNKYIEMCIKICKCIYMYIYIHIYIYIYIYININIYII